MAGSENTTENMEKGMSTFLDVFRRADKNDDGALSWEEFRDFFADGVMSEQELSKLFHEIDTHNTNNIDTEELCTYFSQHLGPFKAILCAIEDLNRGVSDTLAKRAEDYKTIGGEGQFLTRFLLRETINQLSAVQRPLDSASDVLDEQALQEREGGAEGSADEVSGGGNVEVCPDAVTGLSGIVPGRIGRRARRQQLSTQTSTTIESGALGGMSHLSQQVERLRNLIDKMENRVNLNGITDEQLDIKDEHLLQVVQRRLRVNDDSAKPFKKSLRSYVESTMAEDGCLHMNIRCYSGSSHFMVYEIWENEESWKLHMQSPPYKSFQHIKVDCLESPETVNVLQIPESWWKRD